MTGSMTGAGIAFLAGCGPRSPASSGSMLDADGDGGDSVRETTVFLSFSGSILVGNGSFT